MGNDELQFPGNAQCFELSGPRWIGNVSIKLQNVVEIMDHFH